MAGKHVNPCCAPKDKRQQAGGTVRKSGRIIVALLFMILAFGIGYAVFVSASAATIASGKCGGSAEWALTKDGTLTISGTGAMEDYDYIIKPEWDDHKDMIKAVEISDGITYIGNDAFDSCKALAEVTMPDSVTSIGSAFCYCEKLTEITIPDGVTDIGGAAFFGCWALMDINVSQGNEAYCSIDGIVFNKSGSELIRFPSGRTGSYTVPDSVTSICDYAFNGCSSLTEIFIPDSVTSIGSSAFNGCTGLTGMTIPDSVTSIASAFNNCRALTEITLSDSVTSISNYTFSGCVSLADITIPDGVTSIGDWTFSYCTSLAEITIPGSVTSIGDDAFDNCDELSDVYYNGSESDWNRIIIGNGNDCLTFANIHYNSAIPAQGVQPAPTPVLTSAIIASGKCGGNAEWALTEDGTLTISGTGAMEDYDYDNRPEWDDHKNLIKAVKISDGITNIESYAFDNCKALAEVTMPDSVTSIGSAFGYCEKLTEITIPDGVTDIGGAAFFGCRTLMDINVSRGNEAYCSIDGIVFNKSGSELILFPSGRTGSYTVPDSVTSIGDYAFNSCTGLTEITIPDGVTSIGDMAFNVCTGLIKITIPDSVTSIGERALSFCPSLTEITLSDSVTSIDDYTFWNCQSLTSITIPDSVTSIGDYAFDNCISLAEITIPGSVTSIGGYAFANCTSLTEITIPGSVTSIGDDAFDDCDKLSDVYYGGSESDWNRIKIGSDNYRLTFANIHYNSAIPAQGVQPAPTPVLTSAIIASGKCGGSAEWALTEDGTLNIFGTGAMEDYPSSGTQSWSEYIKDVKNARIFDGITHISTYAFSGCTALADITIPNSVTSIDGSEFVGCTALADITIPDSVTNIGGLTFSHCDSLTDIDVSQGNESYCSIDGVLFNKTGSELICFPAGRSGSYTIPSGVTSIGDYAFYGDTALTEIFIPASVTSIEWGAFSLWNTLSDVYYEGSESDWQKIEIDNYGNISLLNAKIHYNSAIPAQGVQPAPTPVLTSAIIASGKCGGSAEWELTDDGTLTISGTGAMEDYGYPVRPEWEDYMNMIKTVRISDGVTSIGDSAFSGCMALTEITIPGSLTNIGFNPFFACYALMDINVDQSNEVYFSIDGVLFNKTASGLIRFPMGRTGSYTVPDSVTSIGDLAFNGCKGLTEITIPGSVMNNIFITAFIGCDNLSDVYYGGSEGDWQKIGDCFIDLTNVKIHYNTNA